MITTAVELGGLLVEVDDATRMMQRSETVPSEVADLVDSFQSVLGAATPLRLEADPYLMTTLWAAAYSADKALRHENPVRRRRELRVALEQFRQALRDIVDVQAVSDDAPIHDVLVRTAGVLAAPQKTFADLLRVSVRQLQRWTAHDGPEPAADDAARIRVVAQVVNQLRHTFTGPGVVAWFNRKHPTLRRKPVDLLGDPLRYPEIVGAAIGARGMTA